MRMYIYNIKNQNFIKQKVIQIYSWLCMGYNLAIHYWIFKDSKDIHAVLRRYNTYVGVGYFVLVHICVRAHTHTHTHKHIHTQPIAFLKKSRSLPIATTIPHYFRLLEKRAMQGEQSTMSWPYETHQRTFCNRF